MRKLDSQANRSFVSSVVLIGLVLSATALNPPSAFAQNQPYGQRPSFNQERSRAEQAAEEQVALSPDTIIGILRTEPGLLLQVKKALVRKAYEQGRILEPNDLTDDALFRLVREDISVCVVATREIENRYYVRAKPTREEIERENYLAEQRGLVKTSIPNSSELPSDKPRKTGTNQEQTYWSTHQGPEDYASPMLNPQQQAPPQNPTPGYTVPNNPARQVQRTSLQPQDTTSFENLGSITGPMTMGGMPRISPEQLPELLSASSSGSMTLTGGNIEAAAARNSQNLGVDNFSRTPSMVPGTSLSPQLAPQERGSLPSQSQMSTLQAALQQPRRPIPQPSDLDEDRPLIRPRPNPYADVPSLYDLYAQVSRRPPVLQHFGMDVFQEGTGNLDDLPMDLPVGPDYVLGPGDGLSIELWGGVAQRLQRVVDREGQVALPEVGTVQVSGRTLGDVQHMVQTVLRTQFRDVAADVSLARIRTVRVYVVGEVEHPGAYDISSLSTPLNALYAAGGPTSRGSLRHLRQSRGDKLVQEIDAYDLLLHGVHTEISRLESGDTLLVPPSSAEVTLEGMVRRPAIYELGTEKSLAELLQLAGGVLPSGTLRHVDVERLVAHEKRTMLRLDMPESNDGQAVNKALEDFQVQDGDKIRISPILPYADKTVYLDGHVFHPGKYPYRDGMKVTDLIHSYSDLLPEPSRRHAEIIRLETPDYKPVVLAFNLGGAMAGQDADLVLKPFDTVRVFGRFDFEDPPVVTVSGEVRDPGDHITNGVLHLRDAVYLAGGVTPDAQLEDAQIYRKSEDGKLKVLSVNLEKALSGDPADDVLLQPKDRVLIHRNQGKVDPPTVQVQGEVSHPGRYPLGEGMTAADLVRLAGGLKRGADASQADLTTYLGVAGSGNIGEHKTVEIASAMAGNADTDVVLHDGDVLTIRQLAGWNDRGASVAIKGEVVHPGTFGIREGERLSSLLARAGGLRSDAYPYGAVLERVQVREIQEKDRADLVDRLQQQGASLMQLPDNEPEQKLAKEASLQQWQTTLQKLQNTPPNGRLVIHISSDVKRWANTPWDVELRSGDTLTIPKRASFVMVNGSVYNPTAVTYRSGKNAAWYLKQAGGPTNVAEKKAIFVIRADGSVVGGSGGMFTGGVLGANLRPGDMLVVPEKAYTANNKWKTTLQASQLVYAVGIAIQVAKSF